MSDGKSSSSSPKRTRTPTNSSHKRKADEISGEERNGIEQLIQASNTTSHLSTVANSSSTVPNPSEASKTTLSFYTAEEAELLTTLDSIVQSYNIYDMEDFYALLEKKCDPFMTLRLKYFNYTVVGIQPILIFCNITHECYPDAMLKILERRIVNLTAPQPATQNNSSKDATSTETDQATNASTTSTSAATASDVKLEFICKFYGTIISNQDIAKICQEFLMSTHVPPVLGGSSSIGSHSTASTSSSTAGNTSKIATSTTSKSDPGFFAAGNSEKKLEDLSMDLARFISNNYLPETSTEGATNRQASYFILELVLTLDSEKKKIIHADMDILAASEHITTFNKAEE